MKDLDHGDMPSSQSSENAIKKLINFVPKDLSSEEKLKIALEQLDSAHQEIGRLIRAHGVISSRFSNSNDLKGSPATLSSNFSGTKPIDLAVSEKKYDIGYVWALALYSRHRKNAGLLRSYRSVQSKRGAISTSLKLTHELASLDRSITPSSIRLAEGRFKEITGWFPKIPGPIENVSNPVPGRIFHLVKESRPYLSNGFTSRSHKNFKAELEAGLEPIVITEPGFPRVLTKKNPVRTEKVDGVLHVRLDVGSIDYSAIPVDQFLQIFANLAYEEIKKYRPSVIHASSGRRGYDTALVGLALKMKTGLPFVYEVRSFFEANWTDDIDRESNSEIFDRRMLVEEMCMHAADKVLTIGEAMRAEIISRGIPSDKVEIIPNAVDAVAFKPRSRSQHLDKKFGTLNLPTIGYVSNMDHYRESQETLIEAVAILRDKGSDVRCVLVGDGPRSVKLKEIASALNVADRVIFTGSVDHDSIPDYYSIIDLFVVPRIPERAATYVTPLKPFEAMAMGLPVIVSNLPALREIVDAPNRGSVFKPGNAQDLADVVEEALGDPLRTSEMARQGREWVTTHRSWTSNGVRYANVFRELKDQGVQ